MPCFHFEYASIHTTHLREKNERKQQSNQGSKGRSAEQNEKMRKFRERQKFLQFANHISWFKVIASILCIVQSIILFFPGVPQTQTFSSLVIIFVWLTNMVYMTCYSTTGPIIRMIAVILMELAGWILVVIFVLFAFTFGFTVLYGDDHRSGWSAMRQDHCTNISDAVWNGGTPRLVRRGRT